MTEHTLLEREEAFARAYCEEYKPQDAAIRAGYTPHSAAKTASKLLKKDRVVRRIEEIRAENVEQLKYTAEYVRNIWLDIVEKARGEKPVASTDRYGEVKYNYKWTPAAALKASELLARDLGMLDENSDPANQAGDDGKTAAQRIQEAREHAQKAREAEQKAENVVNLKRKSGTNG